MRSKTSRRITIRLYNPELIEMIDCVPGGLRSAVIQFALAAYMESETGRAIINNLNPRPNLHNRQKITPINQGTDNAFMRLKGDF